MHCRKNLIISFFLISLFPLVSCDREIIRSGFPNVITLSGEDKGEAVVLSGEIIVNEINVDEAGFIWQIGDSDPVSLPGFRVKSAGTGAGPFSAEVPFSIKKDQNYSLRAYAKCGETVIYGEKLTFQSDLTLPCQLEEVEPEAAFRGDTIQLIGHGFNMTVPYNGIKIGGKNSIIAGGNDTILKCIVPVELTRGPKSVIITVNGIEKDFGTKFSLLLPPPPVAATLASYSVTAASAVLEGSVNPNSLPCTVSFEYGTTTAYGQEQAADPAQISGDIPVIVHAQLSSLLPDTVYHYRIKAVSESGTVSGNDMTFRTLELPPLPVITSLSSTFVKYGNILTVYGQNLDGSTSFLLGSSLQNIQVTPKTITPDSVEIEVYNHPNPSQLLGFSSFRVGFVHQSTTVWSNLVTIGSSWTSLAGLPPGPRYKAGCFSIDGLIYVGGGSYYSSVYKDIWKYDPSSNTWSEMTALPGVARIYPSAVAGQGYGYMGAGFSADNSGKIQLYDFYRYDPAANSWSAMPAYPENISNFFIGFAASVNGRMFVNLSNTVQTMREIVNDNWVSRNAAPELMDNTGTGVLSIGNSFYVICGFNLDGSTSREVWEYNPINDSWTRKANFPGETRHVPVSFSIGSYGYYGCGRGLYEETQYRDMWRYDPANDRWIRIEDFPGGNRSHTVSASDGRYGYAGLGIFSGSYQKDFWKYNPE